MGRERPLELTGDELRATIEAATERIVAHLDGLDALPVENTSGGVDLAHRLREPMPMQGTPLEALLDLLFDEAIPRSFTTVSGGFMAYIPGGGIPDAAVADLIADATNRYVPVWAAAPALNQLESNVVRWFCEMVGYPASAGGVLTPGGSLANLIATVAARVRHLGEALGTGVLYTSDQTHNSVEKSARFAGLRRANIRSVPTDPLRRIDVAALEAAIEADMDAGLTPFLVNGNAGTTNTGAIDDLVAVADVCERHGLWFHADAAYGGFFVLTERGREALVGLDRADSITLDPHKGLFLPYGTGCVLVRDPATLEAAHAVDADYLPDTAGTDLVDYSRLSPELSRDFRGLRVWLPLKRHGVGAFRTMLDEKLDLTQLAAERIATLPHTRVLEPPVLSTFAFRCEPPGVDGSDLDALNQDIMARVNGKGRVMLSGTKLDGRFTPRVSILVFRTEQRHVDHLLEDLAAAVDEALASR